MDCYQNPHEPHLVRIRNKDYIIALGDSFDVHDRDGGQTAYVTFAGIPDSLKPGTDFHMAVSSGSIATKNYNTAIGCSCKDWLRRGVRHATIYNYPSRDNKLEATYGCKHMMAVNMWLNGSTDQPNQLR